MQATWLTGQAKHLWHPKNPLSSDDHDVPTLTPDASNSPRPKFYYGWVVVVVVALGMFTQTAETFNVLSVFLKPMTEEFGWDRTTFAGAMSIGSLLGGAIAVWIGPLMDKFGPRIALVIAFAVLGTIYVLMYWITQLWEFYLLQVIGRMVTNGIIGVASSIIIPKWFIAKRGRAVAFTSFGSQAGSALTPLYVQALISVSGWRLAAMVAGLSVWVLSLIPTALFLRRKPEDMGLLPDGAQPGDSDLRAAAASREPAVSLSIKEARKSGALYLLTGSICISWMIRTGTTLHMVPYFIDHGFSDSRAVTILIVYSTAGFAGAMIWGRAADRFGARLSLALDCVMISVGILLILLADSSLGLALLWAVFWGIAMTGQITLQRVIFADYYGRGRLGSIVGFVTVFQTIAQAVGPLVASGAYDVLGSYTSAFLVFSASSFVGAGLVALARPPART